MQAPACLRACEHSPVAMFWLPAAVHTVCCACFVQKPNRATAAQLKEFHTGDYIQFLERAKPETVTEQEVEHYNVIEDSPIFDGVFQFCQIYAGASIHGAQKLIQGDYDIAINWSGGLHHAKKSQAEGNVLLQRFCIHFCCKANLAASMMAAMGPNCRCCMARVTAHSIPARGQKAQLYSTSSHYTSMAVDR